jgi:hypothetical protein
MKIYKFFMIFPLVIGAFGCANNVWVKPGASVNDFNVDRAQCNAQAYSIPFASVYQQAAVQNECLQGKGWTLRDRASHDAGVASTQSSWQSIMSKNESDSQARCNDPAYKTYYSKTACFTKDITIDQMADASKITPQQKPALIAVKKSLDAQMAQVFISLKQVPNAPGEKMYSIYQSQSSESDKNILDLYSGKTTWGEYNQKRKELGTKLQESFKNLR